MQCPQEGNNLEEALVPLLRRPRSPVLIPPYYSKSLRFSHSNGTWDPTGESQKTRTQSKWSSWSGLLNPWSPGTSPVRPALLLTRGTNLLPLFLETSLQTLKDGELAGLLRSFELNGPSPSYDMAYSHAAHWSPFCGLLVNTLKYESQNLKDNPGMINM